MKIIQFLFIKKEENIIHTMKIHSKGHMNLSWNKNYYWRSTNIGEIKGLNSQVTQRFETGHSMDFLGTVLGFWKALG